MLEKEEDKKRISIAGIWMVIFCAFYMLFIVDKYEHVLESKYFFYVVTTIAMLLGILIFNRKDMKTVKLSITDNAVLVFVIGAIISTITASPYNMQALLGYEGRYTGLIFVLTAGISYFAVSRGYRFNSIHIDILMGSAFITAAFGILDYFNLSILGYRERLLIGIKINNLFSTMGNADTYAAVLVTVLVIVALRFILEEKSIIRHIIYVIAYMVILSGIVVCGSDGALLSIMVAGAIVPLIKRMSRRGIVKWMMLIATTITVFYGWGLVEIYFTTSVVGLQGLYYPLALGKYTAIIMILLWITTGAMTLLIPHKETFIERRTKKIYAAVLIVVVVVALTAVVYVNIKASSGTDMGEMANYVMFDDEWGTQRGYIWRATLEEYAKLPVLKKLIGTGPDTLGIWMSVYRYSDMTTTTGLIYDNAHNEYLQYLFTLGILGCIAMITILISTIRSCMKSDNKWKHIIGAAVLGYAVQAIVGIGDPCSLPVLWTLIAVAASIDKN